MLSSTRLFNIIVFSPEGNWQDDPEGGDEGAVGLSWQWPVGE